MLSDGDRQPAQGSFVDAYYFSIQTMGTIGYGAMYPKGTARQRAGDPGVGLGPPRHRGGDRPRLRQVLAPDRAHRLLSERGDSPHGGRPHPDVPRRNERSNQIIDAHIRVVLMRTELTKEGTTFYRMHDLALARERSPR